MALVFASANINKVVEIRQILPDDIELMDLTDIGCTEDIPETASTIEGNAILKANYVTRKFGLDCFADDSGLEVDALNGAPGVYSARFAGDHKNSDDNISELLRQMEGKTNRACQFKTVIALNIDGEQHLFTGIIRGELTLNRTGTSGFGYDPIFKPDDYDLTFAEIPLELKSRISHRGKAVAELMEFLQNR
ncbi:MAG: non-canonical purine NTP diphosphatase [Flavobacterium sp.]|nr:non-canonical purine NTP diphosphatase [Flavobacterium sp.]